MENGQKLTKKEKKEARKIEWQEKAKLDERNAMIKKYSIWGAAIIIIVLVIGALAWLVNTPSSPTTTQSANIAPVSARDITNGDKNAKVTLIEYADFQCPACAAYHPLVNQLLQDYKGKIYYVYRMFPLENAHQNAIISAQAAYAAYKQGKFFEMDDMLFTNQANWADVSDPKSIFVGYAKTLKLDTNKFQTDMVSAETQKYVKDSENEALSEGINQTPSFILDGVLIQNPNAYADFKKLIDNELNKK